MEITTDPAAVRFQAVPGGKEVLPESVLSEMVSSLESLEATIARLQAIREGILAMASQLAGFMEDAGRAPLAVRDSRRAEMAQRAVAAEVATATRSNDRTVQRQMSQAVELLTRFPLTFGALSDGRISLAHARVIQDAGTVLEGADALAAYETVVVACAEKQAPGRVRRLALREAEKAQSAPFADRHEIAREERRVWVDSLPDGMAQLGAVLPAAVAFGIHDRLTQMALAHGGSDADRGVPAAERPRTMDQLRADLLADLLLCGAPANHDTPEVVLAAITARVEVTVPVLTLIEGASAQEVAAELGGRHPIDPGTARALAGSVSAWNRVLTDPFTGGVLAVERYRPTEELRRLLAARDSRCRFPGCGIKARALDLDHTLDAALGGATETGNLAGLCRRHHMLKHHSRWRLRQTGAGILEWTSPADRTYVDSPPIPPAHTAALISGSGPDPGSECVPPPF